MVSYIVKRLLQFLPTSLAVLCLVGGMVHAIPGDPVDVLLGDLALEEEKIELRTRLGLDAPIPTQILRFLRGVLTGDLGLSLMKGLPVRQLIGERYGATLQLALTTMIIALAIAIPLGIVSAYRAGSAWDHGAMILSLLGASIPTMFLGPMLVLLFAITLGLLPVSGMENWTSLILPSLTMGSALAGILARMIRNTILELMREDFVRTAQAKGLSRLQALLGHILRNASRPVLTIVGLQFGALLTGAVITEKIFDWPGLGSLMIEGLSSRDYPVVQGCIVIFSLSYLSLNLLVDITYGFLDPRIKLAAKT
jgi:peptide/nickel transport system permease protein